MEAYRRIYCPSTTILQDLCVIGSRSGHYGGQKGINLDLTAFTGLLSVMAMRLLQLKAVARTEPDRPAAHVVPSAWLKTLRAVSKSRKPIHTVREFFRGLAMFGGFLGRKSDGEPGWQSIWSGLENLLLCVRGAQAMSKKCG